MFRGQAMGPVDSFTKAIIAPMVERAALTQSLNEGWLTLGRSVPDRAAAGADDPAQRRLTGRSLGVDQFDLHHIGARNIKGRGADPQIKLPVAQETFVMAQRHDLLAFGLHPV